MELSSPDISPKLNAGLLTCQSTSASAERSFSRLKSVICENQNFADAKVAFYSKPICSGVRRIFQWGDFSDVTS